MTLADLTALAVWWLDSRTPAPNVQFVTFNDARQKGQVDWHAGSLPVISLAHDLTEDDTIKVLAHEVAHLILGHVRPTAAPADRTHVIVSPDDYRPWRWERDKQWHESRENAAENLGRAFVNQYHARRWAKGNAS